MSGRWMGDGGRCYLTSYLLLTCTYYLLRATYYLLLTTQAREMLSHNRDEATYLKLQARPPRPATQHRLQPYVLQAATLCGGGCNPTWWRLQPSYGGACKPMRWRLQPNASQVDRLATENRVLRREQRHGKRDEVMRLTRSSNSSSSRASVTR